MKTYKGCTSTIKNFAKIKKILFSIFYEASDLNKNIKLLKYNVKFRIRTLLGF